MQTKVCLVSIATNQMFPKSDKSFATQVHEKAYQLALNEGFGQLLNPDNFLLVSRLFQIKKDHMQAFQCQQARSCMITIHNISSIH